VTRQAIVIATALGAAAVGLTWHSGLPDLAAALRARVDGLGEWTYVIVALLVALETVAAVGLVSPR
jgi:hypothetical protein